MRAALGQLQAHLSVLRVRRPRAAARIEDGLFGLRGHSHLVGEVRALRTRVRELERDHLLLAAHVATLTERSGTLPCASSDTEDEAARGRARLSAIAFYEERIGRLERHVGLASTARHDGRDADAMSIGLTSGERHGVSA